MGSVRIKKIAIKLRFQGKTYSEISTSLGETVPKSTLSTWLKDLKLPEEIAVKRKKINRSNLIKGRDTVVLNKIIDRQEFFNTLLRNKGHLQKLLLNKDVAIIALALLFLTEGSKRSGSLVFGNSDPNIIKLFLHLLRSYYKLDEAKFRCTVQCRTDQDVVMLEKFWSEITSIPLKKFCKAQVDRRSNGKPTQKKGYMGVCRITYFSAEIFNELSGVSQIILSGH